MPGSPRVAALLAACSLALGAGGPRPASDPPREPRRVALLIGIGDYRHLSDTPRSPDGLTDLEGPPNDVQRMRASLRRWGFDGPDVHVLLDSQATRAGILREMERVAERASDPGDVVVVYYSGHGSWPRDPDGDEQRVTPGDTADEALVPWDADDFQAAGELILDDQIHDWLRRIGTRNVTIVVDACYSGTLSRGVGDGLRRPKGLAGNPSPRGTSLELLDEPGLTLITAAGSDQRAEEAVFPEARNHTFGVFTYHFTRALDGAESTTRYDALLNEVKRSIGFVFPQLAQLEGDRAARIFHVQGDVPARPFALVTGTGGDSVRIDAGAVEGVRESSVYDVFGPGEVGFRGFPIAGIRIVEVGERDATGVLLPGAGAVPSGARATLARVPAGAVRPDRLPVYVEPSAPDVAARLAAYPWIRLVDSPSGAVTHVARAHGDAIAVTVRGVPVPPQPYDASGAPLGSGPAGVCDRLSRAYGINAIQLIQNPHPPAGLEVQLRVVPAGTPRQRIRPAREDTVHYGAPGDAYDVWARVDVPAGSPFYLTAAWEGFTGSALLVFPAPGSAPAIFRTNEGWQRIHAGQRFAEPAGREAVKVVVGSDPFSLAPLVDGIPRCGEGGTRGFHADAGAVVVTGWTEIEHPVVIVGRR
jgi:hypothetical protein